MQRFNKRIQSASHIKTVQQRKDSIEQFKKIEILEKQQQKEMKMKNLTPNDYLDQIQFARKNVVMGGVLRIQSAKNYSFFNKVDQISRKGQQNSQNNYSTISSQDRQQVQSLNIPNYQLHTQSQNYQQDSIINNLQKQGIYEQYDLEDQDDNEEDEYI
ncbi:hypothetical protein PPERSA_08624 [Pseudocohnilembus persalinus]|uniref:Uncharacterized protein n=1 Tax=Pseudocohnilembus persalinus TaxID=266149 RepID=A0A0V0R5Z7_PSEPJ|nr:hypothetical protein PPERSA_08624 [Pseudocohnilembus persalinus]|eukprot:KRX09592.1 hypothetical protein PPERSA_08624 [Pseudocohnilembus persalinus]